MRKKVFIIGDCIIKKVGGYLLTNSIKHKDLVKVRPFLAAKAVDIFDYVKPIQRDIGLDAYILHIGTNDLTTDKKPDEICSEISRLVKVLKINKNKIVISAIVPRGDACNTKVEKVNSLLKEFCENNGIDLILHVNITVKRHLNKGRLHLNDTGISRFVRNFRDFLNIFETTKHESTHNLINVSSSSSLSGSLSLSMYLRVVFNTFTFRFTFSFSKCLFGSL